jgi:hypothetical protein
MSRSLKRQTAFGARAEAYRQAQDDLKAITQACLTIRECFSHIERISPYLPPGTVDRLYKKLAETGLEKPKKDRQRNVIPFRPDASASPGISSRRCNQSKLRPDFSPS